MTTRERFAALQYIYPFLKMIWAASPLMAFSNLFLRLVRSFLPLALLYVGKLIIDEVVRLVNMGGASGDELQTIWVLIAIELGLAVLSDVLGRAVTLLDALLGDTFTNDISVKLIRHAATLDLIHFENSEFYDKMERARQQTYSRNALMSMVFKQLQDVLTILSLAGGLIVMAPWLILLLAVALIPAFLGEAHFNAKSYSLSRSWTEERRELDYLRYIGASDYTAKEVKIFGLSGFLANRYGELADEYYLANKNLAVRRASWGGVLAIIGSLGYYLAYAIIVWRTVQGQFSIGDLTFLAGSFRRLRGLLESFLTGFTRIADRALYLKDLFEFFDIEANILSASSSQPVPNPIKKGFRFENVGFKYPGSDVWAVKNLSFTLHADEIIALVGENGAGKTTLVKLLARLYDPDEGVIYLDDKDLRLYDIEALRNKVGVIFQDFVRYALSASENIAIGRIDEREDRTRIVSSADQSMALPVIEGLPEQFDQVLGKRFTNGIELSGGQWQKVALGRAYMRDAELLILDEPTAALDARAEYEVFQRFVDLTRGKMAVLISHRFSTVRMAHRILVLEQGKLIEQGSHDELLALGAVMRSYLHYRQKVIDRGRASVKGKRKSARSIAIEQLIRLDLISHQFDADESLPIKAERDHRLVKEYVQGVLRWKRKLDFLIEHFYRGQFDQMQPELKWILRLGVYDLLFMRTPDHAAIHEAVELAKTRVRTGAGNLANGILRSIHRNLEALPEPTTNNTVQKLGITHSHPDWMVERWLGRYGDQALALLEWNNKRPVFSVRINTDKIAADAFKKKLDEADIEWESSRYLEDFIKVPRLQPLIRGHYLENGLCAVQDESAGLVVRLLDPHPGEHIVDACAAPGGKTLYSAHLMQGKGSLLALDVQENRLERLRNVQKAYDAEWISLASFDIRGAEIKEKADRVLLDVPCTGLGVLSKRADLRWNRSEDDLHAIAKLQRELLEAVALWVKPGGYLLYSTCTIEPEENQEQIKAFLASHPEFEIEKATLPDDVVTPDGFFTTVPHVHDMDGAFAAKLKRTE